MSIAGRGGVPRGNTWMGHPRGLSTLFFTELWERFSYYGMRAILVLFTVNEVTGLRMNTVTAGAIYGLYTAGVYLVALPGGWIADHLLGQRRSIFTGGVIIACGHFSLAIPTIFNFYLGLILIVLGTGLLKPNVSAIVGDLYPEGGSRRDAGFSIFYMGINVGALIGPLVCGFLGEEINWHLGFGAAGVGMVLGLIQFRLGWKYLGDAGQLKEQEPAQIARSKRTFFFAAAIVVLLVLALTGLKLGGVVNLTLTGTARAMGVIIVSLAVLYFVSILLFGKLETAEKKRIMVIFCLFIGAALFWSGFEQAGSSMNLFAERLTNRVVFGWNTPASWLQSVNPLFIIILAPVFGWLWVWLGARKREPSLPVKFAYGLLLLGAGFAVLAWGALFSNNTGPGVSPMWLIVTYFLHTTGELCLSPVGLSSVTKLAPRRLVGQMMGIWFMGSALGNLIAGLIAGMFEALPLPNLFGMVCLMTAGSGVIFLVLSRPIRKLMGDVR